ncbi:MAG: aldo/keto reductase, partial [Parabacteroides sp.]|nr:aldo/keto reductase [Parabacteroides sp.]
MKKHTHHMDRRDFFKIVGITAATTSTTLIGCKSKEENNNEDIALGPIPTDKMTYRFTPTTKDKVSLLGYGCMRWPTVPTEGNNNENLIDQKAVNKLVDYAIAHGVNYFDTAPVYIQGWSEESTGIALKRHPRESFFIATKMSNQRLAGKGLSPKEIFDGSVKMYRESFKRLQVDYIDYYLLHSIGGGKGMETFNERFVESGVLDFLLKEREAGRIRNLGWSFHGDVKVFDTVLDMGVQWDFVQIQLNYLDWEHPSSWNVKAEYLYNELAKRNVPAIIMEPLLGGRLSNVPNHIVARLKQQRPDKSVASWAFRFAGSPEHVLTVLSGMTYMEHLQDNIRTYSPLEPLNEEEKEFLYETAGLIK